jgi:hypothetical protein
MDMNSSATQDTYVFHVFSKRARLFARGFLPLVVPAIFAAAGCAADAGVQGEDEDTVDVTGSEQALMRGGGGRVGYSCTNGVCECDKSIENDCENMSGVCTDGSIDALIACIDGWATTHCTCTQLRSSGGSVSSFPKGGVLSSALQTTAVFSASK